MRLVAVLLLALLVPACKRQDMYSQERSQTWDRNAFFKSGSTMRQPPAGTVPRAAPDASVPAPTVIDAALLARGQERFDIFCAGCHGRTGHGEGMIVQRGFPAPTSLVEGVLHDADAKVFYDTITSGYGAMYSFADRVPPADRWAIIAYIRALQLSQNAEAKSLPAEDQARLAALP